jgi:hypothetical protein
MWLDAKEQRMATRLWIAALAGAALLLPGCGNFGTVEQGRVIAYDKKAGQVTLIRDSTGGKAAQPVYDLLPPVAVRVPESSEEMGPDPHPGRLMRVDRTNREIVIYDAAAGQLRKIPYTPVGERHETKGAGFPVIDKAGRMISVYCPSEQTVVTFAASDELLAMPADTWKFGDEVRYYFRDPAQALRMMNATRTDLNKS